MTITLIRLIWYFLWSGFIDGLVESDLDPRDFDSLKILYDTTEGQFWTWTGTPWNFTAGPSGVCLPNSTWEGITCNCSMQDGCVVSGIGLSLHNLTGTLADNFFNFSHLQDLDVSHNNLFGSLPVGAAEALTLVSLDLRSNQLSGSIPSELGLLTNLQYLMLKSNNLEGSIPPEIGDLISLQALSLGQNLLTGTIPTSFGRLTSLLHFQLAYTMVSGSLPTELASMSMLTVMNLNNNGINGTIPEEYGAHLSALNSLDISANAITGRIPSSFGQLRKLQHLSLRSNLLNGTLWSDLRLLSSLVSLDVSENELTGPVPTAFGELLNLTSLNLFKNQLSQSLPDSLGKLTLLNTLNIAGNSFGGTIPASLGNLSKLETLHCGTNCFEGLPAEIAKMTSLKVLEFDNNCLQGSFPTIILTLTQLTFLSLGNNDFSGPLPESLGDLRLLSLLDIRNNYFGGTVPASFSRLTSLNSLFIDRNNFTGTVPLHLGVAGSLVTLDVSSNQFEDQLPSSLCRFRKLDILNLASNGFNGALPNCIGMLTGLSQLTIGNNNFTGTLPTSIGLLSRLLDLGLWENFFSLTLPTELGMLRNLASMSLYANGFTGTLPTEVGQMTGLVAVMINNNSFSGPFPMNLGNLHRLAYLDAYENAFTGRLTEALFGSTELRQLIVAENYFTGPIPDNSKELQLSATLQYLIYSDNPLSGSIPSTLCGLTSLLYLSMYSNSLTGTVPSCLGDLLQLGTMELYSNSLVGTIPNTFGSFSQLSSMLLYDNRLTGTLPTPFGSSSLRVLSLSKNQLRGVIDPAVNFDLLYSLDLSYNNFEGTIPSRIFAISTLNSIVLGVNCFQGRIPDSVCSAMNLKELVIDGLTESPRCVKKVPQIWRPLIKGVFARHYMAGVLPSCIWGLPNITLLHAAGNGFRGEIGDVPTTSKLTNVSVSNNLLFGTVPISLQEHAKYMKQLDLSSNKFTGTLSSSGFVVPTSIQLDLSVNRLSGDIPSSILQVSDIQVLSGNSFQCVDGQLPSHDPASEGYSCGSTNFDVSLIVWATFAGCFLAAILLVAFLGRRNSNDGSQHRSHNNDHDVALLALLLGSPTTFCDRTRLICERIVEFWKSFQELALVVRVQSPSAAHTIQKFFLILLHFRRAALLLSGSYVVICMTWYVSMKTIPSAASIFSTHAEQYTFTSTVVYLHGLVPAVLTLLAVMLSIVLLRRFLDVSSDFNEQPKTLQSDHLGNNVLARLKRGLLISTVQLFNIFVVLVVNAAYIQAVLRQNPLLFWIQIGLGLFKLFWNNVFVPRAVAIFADSTPSQRVIHNLVMSFFNLLFAPCIVTAFTDSTCFQYIFLGQDSVSTSYSESYVIYHAERQIDDDSAKYETMSIEFANTLTPPWIYSYQCSSALIRNYLPVLIFVYVVSGIVLPTAALLLSFLPRRFLAASSLIHFTVRKLGVFEDVPLECKPGSENMQTEEIGDLVSLDHSPFLETKESSKNPSSKLFQSSSFISSRLVHLTLLITFGLASPLMALIVTFSVFTETLSMQLMLGRYLKITTLSYDDAVQRIAESMDVSWRAPKDCLWLITLCTCLFWLFNVFDMVADSNGAVFSAVFTSFGLIWVPLGAYLVDKMMNRIPRLRLAEMVRKDEESNLNMNE